MEVTGKMCLVVYAIAIIVFTSMLISAFIDGLYLFSILFLFTDMMLVCGGYKIYHLYKDEME